MKKKITIRKSDNAKTKEELIKELTGIRQRVADWEKKDKERKRKIEILQESEKRHKTLIQNQGEGSAIVSPNEQFIYANPAAESIFGVKPNQLVGRSLKDFVEPEQFEMVVNQTKKRRQGRKSVYEHEIIRPDNERREVLVTVTPYFDDQKQFKGALAIFRDITERKRAEEEVKEQKEILKAVIESISDGILVVDEKGKVTHTNERFAEMWQIPKKLVETRDDNKLLDYVLDQLQEPEAFLSRVRQLYESSEESFDAILFKDGRMCERVSFPLMREGNIVGRVWAFRDITERIRVEEEKRKLEKKLQHALKMEAIGTLAGGIAHDFNNILAAVIGYTELVSDDVPKNSIAMKNLQQVLQGAARAKELVKQILTFSREDEEDRKPVLLANIVNESLKLLRASLPTTIDIRSTIDHPLYPILASQTQIH